MLAGMQELLDKLIIQDETNIELRKMISEQTLLINQLLDKIIVLENDMVKVIINISDNL
jgi:hypothetical protein